MALRTGRVILARGIKLDKTYKNILDYSESSMVSLVTSKAVASLSNCSFLRQGETIIEVEVAYGTALQANYIAFENPDYSNKWFFGFIDEVEYVSEKNSRIHYTIDELSTWFDYWNPRACFVVREHTNNDTAGNNTLDENINLGEFVFNGNSVDFGGTYNNKTDEESYICIAVSELIDPFDTTNPLTTNVPYFGGIYSGLKYIFFYNFEDVNKTVDYYVAKGKKDAIMSIFYVPFDFVHNSTVKAQAYQYEKDGQTSYIYTYWIEPTNSPLEFNYDFTKPSTINGYAPKNNKLFTYPYCFFNINNNNGLECEYRYEDFSGVPQFKVLETLCPSMSIKAVARNYKSGSSANTWGEGIMGAKTVQCSWITDYYTNWLTQNAVNLGLQAFGAAAGAGASIAAGNVVGGTMGLVSSIGGIVSEHYRASMVPDQVHGNLNSGDVSFSRNKMCFTFLPKSIKAEYARIIDDYFTMFGYKTSRLKMPNQTGRTYWNYVQIAEGESIGFTIDNGISVPSASMDIINNAYQRGVTIWHNHENIGNYTLSNTIV